RRIGCTPTRSAGGAGFEQQSDGIGPAQKPCTLTSPRDVCAYHATHPSPAGRQRLLLEATHSTTHSRRSPTSTGPPHAGRACHPPGLTDGLVITRGTPPR